MNQREHQNGAVLITSLLMLVVLTLLAVSSIRSSTVNLLIVDNMQSQMHSEALAQRAIAEVLSDHTAFSAPAPQAFSYAGANVSVSAPECIEATLVEGNTGTMGTGTRLIGEDDDTTRENETGKQDTAWEFAATVADAGGGAAATVHQGVQILMPAGNCL